MCGSTGLAAVGSWEDVGLASFIVFVVALFLILRYLNKETRFNNLRVGFFIERKFGPEPMPEPAWDEIPEEWWAWLEDYLKANPPPDWRVDDEPGDEGRGPEAPRPPGH